MTTPTCLSPRLFNRPQAAAYVHRSVTTLNKWAEKGKNLRYTIIGREAFYEHAELEKFRRSEQTF